MAAQIGVDSVLGVLAQVVVVQLVVGGVEDAPGEVLFVTDDAEIVGVGGGADHDPPFQIDGGIGEVTDIPAGHQVAGAVPDDQVGAQAFVGAGQFRPPGPGDGVDADGALGQGDVFRRHPRGFGVVGDDDPRVVPSLGELQMGIFRQIEGGDAVADDVGRHQLAVVFRFLFKDGAQDDGQHDGTLGVAC